MKIDKPKIPNIREITTSRLSILISVNSVKRVLRTNASRQTTVEIHSATAINRNIAGVIINQINAPLTPAISVFLDAPPKNS